MCPSFKEVDKAMGLLVDDSVWQSILLVSEYEEKQGMLLKGGTGTGAGLEEDPAAQSSTTLLPCLVFIHGESYEWNSGNPYDGTLLASTGGVIVVTINFRLGVLGFLKTGSKGSAQGNFGLMDLIAGLHWLRENLALFGGDPQRVTLMGHGTGAALANFIAASPVAKELIQRAILLSGSSTSPWAIQRDPLWVKRAVAEHTGCHGDLHDDDLAPCLRLKPLELLLTVRMDIPRFLPGFAPFVDGTLLVQQSSTAAPFQTSTSAFPEVFDFPGGDLLLGLTSCESYLDVDAQELRFGFDERRRDRILRTYVRNAYRYHLNEIFSALKNEYTDWERPTQNPLSVRDATLDVLSDGHTAAPLLRLAHRHASASGTTKTFFMHFRRHESADIGEVDNDDFPLRSGSVRGEDVPYILGLPMIGGGSFFPYNYTRGDAAISKTLIRYMSNFIKNGDPNGVVPNASNADDLKRSPPDSESSETVMPYWDTYDSINQFYLEIGNRPERKDHYRGHKMSLWLNLIPQLHRPGEGEDVSMRHHHFQEEDEEFYDGFVRPQSKQKPTISLVQVITPPPVPSSTVPTPLPPKSDTALQATTTECPPNGTHLHHHQQEVLKNPNNLLRKLATNYHYQNYTTALTITITVGCFLLLLNILIFAGIYHQRGRARNNKRKQQDQLEVGMGSGTSSPSEELFQQQKQPQSYEVQAQQQMSCKSCAMAIHDYIEKSNEEAGSPEDDAQFTEMTLQQFSSSPVPGKRSDSNYPDVTSTGGGQPPPTSETQNHAGGILRPHRLPATPSQMKKRVQIQEISV